MWTLSILSVNNINFIFYPALVLHTRSSLYLYHFEGRRINRKMRRIYLHQLSIVPEVISSRYLVISRGKIKEQGIMVYYPLIELSQFTLNQDQETEKVFRFAVINLKIGEFYLVETYRHQSKTEEWRLIFNWTTQTSGRKIFIWFEGKSHFQPWLLFEDCLVRGWNS